jgi:hypothetical protein
MIWVLSAILWFGIFTLRIPSRWALTAFELALFAFAAALLLKRRGLIHFHPIAILLASAAAWGLLQLALSSTVEPQHTLESVLHWATNCAAFCIAFTVTEDGPRRRQFLTTQLVLAMILSIGAVIWFFTASTLGPFVYRNQFACFLEPMLGLAIAAAIRDRQRSFVWVLVAAELFSAVVAGGSRTGAILCSIELISIPMVAFARGSISGRSLARVAAISVMAAAALVVVVGWEKIWQRLQEPNPYALRLDLDRSTLAMVRDRPLLGFGLGAWPDAYPGYARFDDGNFVNQAHDDWAQWAAEGGVPFFLMMAAIVVCLLRPAWHSLWGLGLMAVFLHALVDYPMQQRPALAAFFFALAGVLARERPAET